MQPPTPRPRAQLPISAGCETAAVNLGSLLETPRREHLQLVFSVNSCKKGTAPINPSRGSFLETQFGFCSPDSSLTEGLPVQGRGNPKGLYTPSPCTHLAGSLGATFSVLISREGTPPNSGHQSPLQSGISLRATFRDRLCCAL